MEFRVLGKLEVVHDGHAVDLGAFRQRALLGLLLTTPNSVLSTDRILDELWGGTAARQAELAVGVRVGPAWGAGARRAKRSEGTILLTRAPGYLVERPGRDRRGTLRAAGRRGPGAGRTDPAAASWCCGGAWPCGGVTPTRSSPTNRGRRGRSPASRSCVWRRSRTGSTPISRGLSRELVPELQSLVRQHPLRERLTAVDAGAVPVGAPGRGAAASCCSKTGSSRKSGSSRRRRSATSRTRSSPDEALGPARATTPASVRRA